MMRRLAVFVIVALFLFVSFTYAEEHHWKLAGAWLGLGIVNYLLITASP